MQEAYQELLLAQRPLPAFAGDPLSDLRWYVADEYRIYRHTTPRWEISISRMIAHIPSRSPPGCAESGALVYARHVEYEKHKPHFKHQYGFMPTSALVLPVNRQGR